MLYYKLMETFIDYRLLYIAESKINKLSVDIWVL